MGTSSSGLCSFKGGNEVPGPAAKQVISGGAQLEKRVRTGSREAEMVGSKKAIKDAECYYQGLLDSLLWEIGSH